MQPGQKWTYEEVADRVRESRAILHSLGIKVHRDSVLSIIFRAAENFAEIWSVDRQRVGLTDLINAGNANRLADSIIAIEGDGSAVGLLRKICGSNVNFSSRTLSQGKDAFWEIELAAFLRRRGAVAAFVDPPDLVTDFGCGDYAIACKKIYSERNVEKQVSKGARQIVKSGMPGIVALNIDDLVPEGKILNGSTGQDVLDLMARFNRNFLDRHRRYLQGYVQDGRLDAVLVSVSCPLDVKDSSPRFNNGMQVSMWTLDQISVDASRRIGFVKDYFSDILV